MEQQPVQSETPQEAVTQPSLTPVNPQENKPKVEGRPSVITEQVVAKLEELFKIGCTVETACNYAEIDKSTYARHLQSDPAFATRIRKSQEFARIAAGQLVVNDFVKNKNVDSAKWWLEKKHRAEFGSQESVYQQFNVGGEMSLSFLETNGSKIT